MNKTYTFTLKTIPLAKYFVLSEEEKQCYQINNEPLKEFVLKKLEGKITEIKLVKNKLTVYGSCLKEEIQSVIRDYYENNQTHISRMFGSYVLIKGNKKKLTAVKATPIPIKYCPLMIKLLKEVGGHTAEKLLKTLNTEDKEYQSKMMCNLINEVVIRGGYFDTNRPLNSCEANVLFGASETMSSAFLSKMIDAAVIVSNNLGTIITTNNENTQGAVKRMTGLFYTSPSAQIVKTALQAKIIPVFPYTAEINQIAGVRKAIALGYKKIAVSIAAADNCFHKKLKQMEEKYKVTIYKFGLCSTGINEKTAKVMQQYADVIWSCASKQVKAYVVPFSLAQVGIKIPVHIMTQQGYKIVKNHLMQIEKNINYDKVHICRGENKPIFLNDKGSLKVVKQKEVLNCTDCPHPCI